MEIDEAKKEYEKSSDFKQQTNTEYEEIEKAIKNTKENYEKKIEETLKIRVRFYLSIISYFTFRSR